MRLNVHRFNNQHPDNIDRLKGGFKRKMGGWVGCKSRQRFWVVFVLARGVGLLPPSISFNIEGGNKPTPLASTKTTQNRCLPYISYVKNFYIENKKTIMFVIGKPRNLSTTLKL
jgi:hypothetical protein